MRLLTIHLVADQLKELPQLLVICNEETSSCLMPDLLQLSSVTISTQRLVQELTNSIGTCLAGVRMAELAHGTRDPLHHRVFLDVR